MHGVVAMGYPLGKWESARKPVHEVGAQQLARRPGFHSAGATMAEVIDSSQPTIYQIRLRSHLSPDWTDWFGD